MSLFCVKCGTANLDGSTFCDRCGGALSGRTPGETWIIGSEPGCDIIATAATVSSRHCKLSKTQGTFWIEDLGSTNGTYVDGVRISTPVRIEPRNRVTLGKQFPMPWPKANSPSPALPQARPAYVPSPIVPPAFGQSNQSARNVDISRKPGKITAIGVLTLIDGIFNTVGAFFVIPFVLGLGASTCGIGCLFLVIPALFMTFGIFEIIRGSKLLANPLRCPKPGNGIPIIQIISIIFGNILAITTGILALVFFNDPEVNAYWEALETRR